MIAGGLVVADGPGEYDEECAKILMDNEADVVVVVVLGGKRGSSFSLNAIPGVPVHEKLPKLLRELARQIEEN